MYVVESVNNFLAPMRERRAELVQDMDYVARDVLAEDATRNLAPSPTVKHWSRCATPWACATEHAATF